MSYHIVSIDSPQCSLSCKDGQLTCRVPGEEKPKTLPLEDIASIIVTSFSASIHSELFLQAAKHGVALIICEEFKPVSLVLPANRSTDTILSRAMLTLSPRVRAHLWQKTIDAKCQNQFVLAEHVAPKDKWLDGLREAAFGKKPHKEAICAKMFWQIFGRSLGDEEFVRERGRGGLNNLLNYGYAVLLSTVLQKLFGVGLDPTYGIAHVARERSTPLAYDLMEPFRPCVDWRVIQWVKQLQEKGSSGRASAHSSPSPPRSGGEGRGEVVLRAQGEETEQSDYEVTKEFRKWVTGFPLVQMDYLDLTLEIQGIVEGVVRGFRRAVVENQPRYYKPWTPKNTKWAG